MTELVEWARLESNGKDKGEELTLWGDNID